MDKGARPAGVGKKSGKMFPPSKKTASAESWVLGWVSLLLMLGKSPLKYKKSIRRSTFAAIGYVCMHAYAVHSN